jgi:quercetin dioxygenase-like cupin family protein
MATFLRRFPGLLAMSFLGVACAARSAPHPPNVTSASPDPPISRTLLEHHDLAEMPGWETRLYRIEYGPGVAAPKHHHPVEGMGYVVSGSFESAFEGETPTVVHEGQSFTDRPLATHTLFRNADPSKPLTFIISYVVRKGDPVVETP